MKVVRIDQFIFCVRKRDFAISLGGEWGRGRRVRGSDECRGREVMGLGVVEEQRA